MYLLTPPKEPRTWRTWRTTETKCHLQSISEETHGVEGALPLRLHENRLQTLNALCVSVCLQDTQSRCDARLETFQQAVTNWCHPQLTLQKSRVFSMRGNDGKNTSRP